MFIFRRLEKKDTQISFFTGNYSFDELAPQGSLKNYIDSDTLKGGPYLTYLLIEEQTSTYDLLGLLRYRISSKKEFIEELDKTSIKGEIRSNIYSLLSLNKYDIIYLSRIGVTQEFQEMRISQIISNFFEFLIQRKKKNFIIYTKILEHLTNVMGSHYQILSKGTSKKWGNYFLISKIIEYNPAMTK